MSPRIRRAFSAEQGGGNGLAGDRDVRVHTGRRDADHQMRDLGRGRSEHLLRASLRVVEHLGRVRRQHLTHHHVQILGARHHLAHVHLTLAEPPQDRRSVVQRFCARQLLDRLGTLARIRELHALNAERARRRSVLRGLIGVARARQQPHERGAQSAEYLTLTLPPRQSGSKGRRSERRLSHEAPF